MLKKIVYKSWTSVLKTSFFAKCADKLTGSKWSSKLIPWYIKHYQVSETTINRPLAEYTSLQDFFTRKMDLSSIEFKQKDNLYISPVEAKVKDFGEITPDKKFFIKDNYYSLIELLGDDTLDTSNSHFIILYLSPKNYHRFHAPITGQYSMLRKLGKSSYPVNDAATTYIDGLFTKNHRGVYQMNEDFYVPVGALNINSIQETFENGATLAAGEELGYFNFGSTVVLFFMNKTIEWSKDIEKEKSINLGDDIATIIFDRG